MHSGQRGTEGAPAVHRLLVGLVTAVCRRPWLTLALAVLVGAASVLFFFTRLEYHTQRSDLISAHKECQRRWQKYLAEFGNDEDLVVVVRGADRGRMTAALEAVAAEVRRRPDRFDRLFYKVDLRHLQGRALLYLPLDQIRAIHGNLDDMGPLLNGGPLGWRLFLTLDNLVRRARSRVEAVTPGGRPGPRDEQFLRQLTAVCQSAGDALGGLESYRDPWAGLLPGPSGGDDPLAEPRYFFSGDGELGFLLARPVKEPGSFTAAKDSVEAMREVVELVKGDFPDLQLGLTGVPVLEDDEMTASQRDTNLASWLALAGVGVLYLLVFRGLRYPLLTVATLVLGTAWTMGWLTLTVGHLNILSATFVMMLIGIGDYGVLWVTRYEQERAAGADVLAALRRTAESVGPGIVTAAVTTSLAFFAAMLADFKAVAELGWIAGSGVLLCALSCCTALPALLRLVDRRRSLALYPPNAALASGGPGAGPVWLPAVARRPRCVLAAAAAATALLALFCPRVGYDHNLLHLQSKGLESVRWETALIEHTADASWQALSYTASREEALARKARFERLPGVARVVEVASLVPDQQGQKLPLLEEIRRRLRDLPRTDGRSSPLLPADPAGLSAEIGRLLARLQGGTAEAAPGLADSLAALRDRLDRLPAGEAAARLRDFDRRLASDLLAALQRLRSVSTPAAITLEDLPPELRERYVGRDGQWLLRVFGKQSLWDYEPLEDFVRQVRAVDPEATGTPFGTLEGLQAMKNGFERAGLYALAVIALVLLADFRRVGRVLLALAPLALGSVWTLGLMGLCGLPFNPANMIALPLIVGVGVDNGVHVLHDYWGRADRRDYRLARSTGQGMFVAALTTVLGFGSLAVSSHRGLVGLGVVLGLGVTCCMVTALVLLPAALRLWGGRGVETRAAAGQVDDERPARSAA